VRGEDVLISGFRYKLKVDACEKNSAKYRQLSNLAINYLSVSPQSRPLAFTDTNLRRYRYGALIVFANYLIESRERGSPEKPFPSFPDWLKEHREITKLLSRRTLD